MSIVALEYQVAGSPQSVRRTTIKGASASSGLAVAPPTWKWLTTAETSELTMKALPNIYPVKCCLKRF